MPLNTIHWESQVGRLAVALRSSHWHLVGQCEKRLLDDMGIEADPAARLFWCSHWFQRVHVKFLQAGLLPQIGKFCIFSFAPLSQSHVYAR